MDYRKNRKNEDPFFSINTIYGVDQEHDTPYMTRIWIGRLRLHIFHRPDEDRDPHDHPWAFWTFPLTSYVEEVTTTNPKGFRYTVARVVPAWRWSYRPATHTHRVTGRLKAPYNGWLGPEADPTKKIITIVWRGRKERSWGFLKNRNGQWCWIGWRDYVFNGGKHTACEPLEKKP